MNKSFSLAERIIWEHIPDTLESRYDLDQMDEYVKLIYLKYYEQDTYGYIIQPSTSINVVWRDHVLYNLAYDRMCCFLFDSDTLIGYPDESLLYDQDCGIRYRRTHVLYQSLFKIKPPISVWPILKDYKRECTLLGWNITKPTRHAWKPEPLSTLTRLRNKDPKRLTLLNSPI